MATTPNDEVNSLAAQHFVHVFGREYIWQVAPFDDDKHHSTAVAAHMRGRIPFPSRPKFGRLERFAAEGAVIKKTTLTEQLTYDDFKEMYGDDHILLFQVSEERGLLAAHDAMRKPIAGTTLYAMIRPEDA